MGRLAVPALTGDCGIETRDLIGRNGGRVRRNVAQAARTRAAGVVLRLRVARDRHRGQARTARADAGRSVAGSHRLPFRPDIEGLRAIAVVLVVAFHAGVPAISGGYVGVDVFYVISGFLITGLLVDELQRTGSISFASFYARRARRLVPLAALVLVAVAIGMEFFTPPVFRPTVRLRRDLGGVLLLELAVRARVGQLPDARRRAESGPALLVTQRRGAVLLRVAGRSPACSPAGQAGGAPRRRAPAVRRRCRPGRRDLARLLGLRHGGPACHGVFRDDDTRVGIRGGCRDRARRRSPTPGSAGACNRSRPWRTRNARRRSARERPDDRVSG